MSDYQKLTKLARKSFEGHRGRPGQVGGSLPRSGGAGNFGHAGRAGRGVFGGQRGGTPMSKPGSFEDRAARWQNDEEFQGDVEFFSKEMKKDGGELDIDKSGADFQPWRKPTPGSEEEKANTVTESVLRKGGSLKKEWDWGRDDDEPPQTKYLEFDKKAGKYDVSTHVLTSRGHRDEQDRKSFTDYIEAWDDLNNRYM